MAWTENPIDDMLEAQQRFARLHFRAASVRLEDLREMLERIEHNGGVTVATPQELGDVVGAAAEVLENLRAAKQRFSPTEQFKAGKPTASRLRAIEDGDSPPRT